MSISYLWDSAIERALALEVRRGVGEANSRQIRYVDAPNVGWIRAYKSLKPKRGVDYLDIPNKCKVDLIEQTETDKLKIDVFRLAESTSQFRTGTVLTAFWIDGKTQLSTVGEHSPAVKLVLDLEKRQLLFNGEVLAPAFTAPPPGSNHSQLAPSDPGKPYSILKPSIHERGRAYGPLATTWFRIETYASDVWTNDGIDGNGKSHKKGGRVTDRYVHCGSASWGCATVGQAGGSGAAAYSAWLPVYQLLIGSRSTSREDLVGHLEVVAGGAQ